ncbi:hypothetical protein M8C21_023171, partial [Ambrosia artemisiifolia]
MSSSRKTRTIAPNHCVGLLVCIKTPPRINTMIQAHFHRYNLELVKMAADVASPSEIAPLGTIISDSLPLKKVSSFLLSNFTKLEYVKVLRGDKS